MTFLLGSIAAAYILVWIILILKNPRSNAVRALLLHASLAISILMIELASIGIGLDYRLILGTLGDEPWYNPLNRIDQKLLHIHKPNQTFEGVQPTGDIAFYYNVPNPNPYPYSVNIDSRGFRNSKENPTSEIVVIGDSFVEAIQVTEEQMFSSLLEQRLDKSVTNLGQIWYGPQQEFEVLNRFALPLKPSTIVWVYFAGNDLQDFIRYEQVSKEYAKIGSKRESLFEKSLCVNVLRKLRSLTSPVILEDVLQARCLPKKQLFYFNYQPVEETPEISRALTNTLALWQQAASLSAKHGAKFLLVYLPSKLEAMEKVCKLTPKTRPVKQQLLQQLRVRGLYDKFLDLTPALQENAATAAMYYTDDTHLSEEGHQIVADTIAQHLMSTADSR